MHRRKLTRQERFLSWLLARVDDRLALVSDREWERHNRTAVARVMAFVNAPR